MEHDETAGEEISVLSLGLPLVAGREIAAVKAAR